MNQYELKQNLALQKCQICGLNKLKLKDYTQKRIYVQLANNSSKLRITKH